MLKKPSVTHLINARNQLSHLGPVMAKGVYREYVRTPLANVAKDRLLRLCDNIIAPDYNINSFGS